MFLRPSSFFDEIVGDAYVNLIDWNSSNTVGTPSSGTYGWMTFILINYGWWVKYVITRGYPTMWGRFYQCFKATSDVL